MSDRKSAIFVKDKTTATTAFTVDQSQQSDLISLALIGQQYKQLFGCGLIAPLRDQYSVLRGNFSTQKKVGGNF
jgi:hypothetical protein